MPALHLPPSFQPALLWSALMRRCRTVTVLFAAGSAIAAPALASSEDAWAELRADIKTKCVELVEASGAKDVQIEVNPFGSEHFGAALMSSRDSSDAVIRAICIYDKRAKTAELTAPFDAQ